MQHLGRLEEKDQSAINNEMFANMNRNSNQEVQLIMNKIGWQYWRKQQSHKNPLFYIRGFFR